jgi:hypothetical protein
MEGDDYEVIFDGVVVDRIFNARLAGENHWGAACRVLNDVSSTSCPSFIRTIGSAILKNLSSWLMTMSVLPCRLKSGSNSS